jgi:hypothetical protein
MHATVHGTSRSTTRPLVAFFELRSDASAGICGGSRLEAARNRRLNPRVVLRRPVLTDPLPGGPGSSGPHDAADCIISAVDSKIITGNSQAHSGSAQAATFTTAGRGGDSSHWHGKD